MILTVFLAILVLALVLGNAFLTIASPSRLAGTANLRPSPAERKEAPDGEGSDSDRIKVLHKRIERLEGLLLRLNNKEFVAKKFNGTNICQKINDLEEFRQNARLEIAALKQQVASNGNGHFARERGKKEIARIEPERLHKIVYRSAD